MALNFQNSETLPVRRVLLVVLLVASLAMVTVYAREGEDGPLHAVQNAVGAAVSPLKFAGASVAAGAGAAGEGLRDAAADESTLSALRERNAELTEQLAQETRNCGRRTSACAACWNSRTPTRSTAWPPA